MTQHCADRKQSYRLVIIDGPDSWAKELAEEKIVEKFYGIDFTDESTIFDRCLAKIKEAESASPLPPDPPDMMRRTLHAHREACKVQKSHQCIAGTSTKLVAPSLGVLSSSIGLDASFQLACQGERIKAPSL